MFGPIPVMFGATGLTAVILFCWIAVKSYAGFVVWCLAIGFTSGLFVSVNPVVASLPMVSPPEVLGTRFGIIWFVAAIGALVGTPIAGALANPSAGDFLKAQIFTACIMTGAALLIFILFYASRHFQREGSLDRKV
jgi:MFS family permease